MVLTLLSALVLAGPTGISRDEYGVPTAYGDTVEDAYFQAGRAVAQDRLWQMEMSRRIARGQMSEVFGPDSLASDRDALRMAYTEKEYQEQIKKLPKDIQQGFQAYADGINASISERTKAGTLPGGYAQYSFSPRTWTAIDSMAISVRLLRLFGTGGAGEIRNLALLKYLQGKLKGDQALDVVDDLAWFNEPSAPTTLADADDKQASSHLVFEAPIRAVTLAHLASLPQSSLLELAGAVRMASSDDQKLLAQDHQVFYKTGSYAALVAPKRATDGSTILMNGPQMGHSIPSVVHEMTIRSGNTEVTGMDVPGIPGVLIGSTSEIAWGFTSGVADIADIFVTPLQEGDAQKYVVDGASKPVQQIKFKINVKGQNPVEFVQERTQYGPVILRSNSGKCLYSQRSTQWMREYESMIFINRLASMSTPIGAYEISKRHTSSFNFFFATKSGQIGWRYCGLVPLRSPNVDPRFPILASKKNDWLGMIPEDKMPAQLNPREGLITNWNNKPVSWWPNWDTPAWGKFFHVTELNAALSKRDLSKADIKNAVSAIAKREDGYSPDFIALLEKGIKGKSLTNDQKRMADMILSYTGDLEPGSPKPVAMAKYMEALRNVMVLPVTGNFMSQSTFNTVTQPSFLIQAISGKSKFDFLKGATPEQMAYNALVNLTEANPDPSGWSYVPGSIRVTDQPSIPFINRGTYIQIVSYKDGRRTMETVLNPGVSEAGPFSQNQVPLAREFGYKPVPR